MKKFIIVTGGVGFVGSNLIEYLIKKTNFDIISIDNYSSGLKKNEIKSKRIRYINSDTRHISKVLSKYKKKNKLYFSLWRICKNISKFYKNG